MIKTFVKRIGSELTDAWISILTYIDGKLDNHETRISDLEDEVKRIGSDYDKTAAKVDSDSETRKLIKKTAITGLVGGIITYILVQFGLL